MKNPIKAIAASFSTRAFRAGGYSVAAGAIVIAIAVMVNLFVAALPGTLTQIDTTASGVFTLSQQSERLVGDLEENVTIYWIVRAGQEESYLENLLNRYVDLSDRLNVVKKDPDVYPTFADSYTDSLTENSLVVTCGDRYRYVDYYDIFVMDYTAYYYYGESSWSFDGESQITSAIDYVTREDLPKVYLLTGHGEGSLSSSFTGAVSAANIETAELSLRNLPSVPEDAGAVLIHSPKSDISTDELEKLREYLGNGGKLMLITDPPQSGALTNLEAFMADYGVHAQEGIVIEGSQNNYIWGTPYYLMPSLSAHAITQPLISDNYRVVLPIAQGLTVEETLPDSVTVTEFLTTSDSAYAKLAGYELTTYEKEEGDVDGPFALGVAVSQEIDDGITAEVIWISSGALVEEESNATSSGANLDLFLNALAYLGGSAESNLTIHSKSLDQEMLTMDSGTSSMLTVLVLGIIPLAYLLVGVLVWARRKRR